MAKRSVRVTHAHVVCFDNTCGLKKEGTIGFPSRIQHLQLGKCQRMLPLTQQLFHVDDSNCHYASLQWMARVAR